jgi:hypothetical protein
MPCASVRPAVGFAFDEATGRVYEHTGRGVTVVFPWPVLVAYTRPSGLAEWEACHPDLLIPGGEMDDDGTKFAADPTAEAVACPGSRGAVQRFCANIPAEIRQRVVPFADRHWHLLRWLARSGQAAEDLCASNPVLAYMVASGWARPSGPWLRGRCRTGIRP